MYVRTDGRTGIQSCVCNFNIKFKQFNCSFLFVIILLKYLRCKYFIVFFIFSYYGISYRSLKFIIKLNIYACWHCNIMLTTSCCKYYIFLFNTKYIPLTNFTQILYKYIIHMYICMYLRVFVENMVQQFKNIYILIHKDRLKLALSKQTKKKKEQKRLNS